MRSSSGGWVEKSRANPRLPVIPIAAIASGRRCALLVREGYETPE